MENEIKNICKLAKEASLKFSSVSTDVKNELLKNIKKHVANNTQKILEANKKDLAIAKSNNRDAAFMDRLMLNEDRVLQMCKGVDAVISLEDPVGKIVSSYDLKNGLHVDRVRSPLGVIGIIFEARPNVSLDAAILCIKSGNGVVLRGSRESINSVEAIVDAIKLALVESNIDPALVSVINSLDRKATIEMLKQDKYIDIVIPRGGEGLKKVVLENATMPVLASAGGNCHMYIAKSADIDMSKKVVYNAKVSRPGVCNALETLLIDKSIAKDILKDFCDMLKDAGIEIRVSKEAKQYCPYGIEIEEEEYYKEYHGPQIKVLIVDGIDNAIYHINKYSTNHSDAIMTTDKKEMEKFSREVDSAAVYINASTRFTDGFELGLGAEMGISTQKLHVRGPIGIEELTSVKYVINGNGQVR
ncbi:MAG TPA: glutamate-5-semialdehyde dehydrogenase [Clostridiales bacterium]|nr:glutamate-5-semialdehyde dehydrogenase [Clostridiales bacterium]